MTLSLILSDGKFKPLGNKEKAASDHLRLGRLYSCKVESIASDGLNVVTLQVKQEDEVSASFWNNVKGIRITEPSKKALRKNLIFQHNLVGSKFSELLFFVFRTNRLNSALMLSFESWCIPVLAGVPMFKNCIRDPKSNHSKTSYSSHDLNSVLLVRYSGHRLHG